MTARTGMANLILEVRKLAKVTTSDTTIGSTTYWSDDHIQAELDRYRKTWKNVLLLPSDDFVSGAYSTTEYYLPDQIRWIEESATGSGWRVYDSTGTNISSASYAVNYQNGIITFTSDQDRADRYLDCHSYDLYSAVADIWEAKASFYAEQVDWSSDNHNFKNSQKIQQYQKQARMFRAMSGRGAGRLTMVRADER